MCYALLLFLLCASAWITPLRAQETRDTLPLRLVDGRVLDTKIVSIDEQSALWLEGEQQPIQVSDVVQYGQLAENLAAQQIVLANGSVLVAELIELSNQRVLVGAGSELFADGSIWGAVHLPRSAVCGVIFRPPPIDAQRDQLFDELRKSRAEDHLWLDNGDRISGKLIGPTSTVELADPNRPWQMQVATQQLTVPRETVIALALRSTGTSAPVDEKTATMLVGFRDGSYLYASQMHIGDGNFQWQLAGQDATIQLSTATAMAELCCFRPIQRAVVFLSDLSPLGYVHVPLLRLRWSYAEDRNVLGGRLRTADWLFDKGLGMHSTSRLAYVLPAGAQRFQAELALDRSSGQHGSVQGRVYLQSPEGQWTMAYETPILRGGESPLPIDVPVAAARAIALIVDQADYADQLDRANWLGARIVIRKEE